MSVFVYYEPILRSYLLRIVQFSNFRNKKIYLDRKRYTLLTKVGVKPQSGEVTFSL